MTVPSGTYLVGSVYLGDRTELHLQEGTTLLGSPDLADYNAPDAYPQNWCSDVSVRAAAMPAINRK